MKHLKGFFESNVNIYDEKIKEFLPEEMSIYTSNGSFILKKDVITREIDILRVCYSQNTPESDGGDVLADGEPDTLEFDFHFVKDNEKLKILVDITYGDQMVSEFTLQQPDKVDVTHYTGLGSIADPDTHFGLDDESMKKFIKFINAFGFTFQPKDFSFIDKYPETYVHEDVKLTPLSGDQKVLIVNNAKPQESRYLKNVLKFMKMRGIEHIVANNDRDVERLSTQQDIVGVILTGSDYRFTKPLSDHEGVASKKALEILKCPILGIGYGFDSMAKFHGGTIKDLDKLNQTNTKLTEFDSTCPLFKGVDMKTTDFSFAYHEIVTNCPNGFKVIGKVGDVIVGISNDSLKRYGILFHPEDIERTFKVLDNFTDMFHNGQKEQDALKQGKFQYLESFKNFKI